MTSERRLAVLKRAWAPALVLCLLSASVSARAQAVAEERAHEDPLVSEFEIDDDDPESSIPTGELANRKPLQMGYYLMNLSERADAATARGDHLAAAKYWKALGKTVPDRSISFVRACKAYEAAGALAEALEQCRTALGKGGVTVDDHLRFVQLVLKKPGELSESDILDVDTVAQHIQDQLKSEQGEVAKNLLLCQLGSRINDVERMRRCTARLQELAPNDPQTIVYKWSLAVLERDYDRANSVLDRAKESKLTSGAIAKMRESVRVAREKRTEVDHPISNSWLFSALPMLAVVLLALVVIYKLRRHSEARP